MMICGEASVYKSPMFLPKKRLPTFNIYSLLIILYYFHLLMAEHPDKPLHVRADTYGGWHTHLPHDSMFKSACGQISPSKSHDLSAKTSNSQQQDAVGCSVSNNFNPPNPMHFRHTMRWPQIPRSGKHGFPSIDLAHFGFDSDLEPNEQIRYAVSNNSYSEVFNHQPAQNQVELSAFDIRSPISGYYISAISFHGKVPLTVARSFTRNRTIVSCFKLRSKYGRL